MAGCQEGAMTYREVTMIEVKEILRLWLSGVPKRRIGLTVGVDRKTVRSYVRIAGEHGLTPGPDGIAALTDERFEAILLALKPSAGRPHGEAWARCLEQRTFIEQKLKGAKLSKVRR